jgi:hypothetical protein
MRNFTFILPLILAVSGCGAPSGAPPVRTGGENDRPPAATAPAYPGPGPDWSCADCPPGGHPSYPRNR